jgi:hypothetical protein
LRLESDAANLLYKSRKSAIVLHRAVKNRHKTGKAAAPSSDCLFSSPSIAKGIRLSCSRISADETANYAIAIELDLILRASIKTFLPFS